MSDGYGKSQRQRHTGSRPQPYDPSKDRTHASNVEEGADEEMFETPANAFKVGATTDVRELAGTITQAVNFNTDMPALLTIGAPSINQAVKGIAAAAAELKGGAGGQQELTFQPAFRHVNRTKPLIAFYLSRQRFHDRMDTGEVVELTATANQKIVGLAGAIAGKVRELKRVHLLGVGADAVTNAVLAIGNARLFLEQDSLDIKVVPEFVKIMKNGQQMNAVKLNVVPERIA